MFKLLLLQQGHGLSDFKIETKCIDRIRFSNLIEILKSNKHQPAQKPYNLFSFPLYFGKNKIYIPYDRLFQPASQAEDRIHIAVNPYLIYVLHIPRSFSFFPYLLPASAPEMRNFSFYSFLKSLPVHISARKHFSADMILTTIRIRSLSYFKVSKSISFFPVK